MVEEEDLTVTRTDMSNFFEWLGDRAHRQANCATYTRERDDYLAGKRNDIPSFRNCCPNFNPAEAKDIALERDVAEGDDAGINAYFGVDLVGPLWFIR